MDEREIEAVETEPKMSQTDPSKEELDRLLMPPPRPRPSKRRRLLGSSRICLVGSKGAIEKASQLKIHGDREKMFFSLLAACQFTRVFEFVAPVPCKAQALQLYHSLDYIDVLREAYEMRKRYSDGIESEYPSELVECGLEDDCFPFKDLFEYCLSVVGTTLCACKKLAQMNDNCVFPIVINWFGGRHHGQPAKASGYCFINDVVLGLIALQEHYDRILYVDIDAHHGDGVQNAFQHDSGVFTVSLHKFGPGVFPGTGELSKVGKGLGKYFNLNAPTATLDDSMLMAFCRKVIPPICRVYRPQALVLLVGADGLYEDPMKLWKLTAGGIALAVEDILAAATIPTLILGGGGYNAIATAKCWVHVSARVAGLSPSMPEFVPEHDLFPAYAPDFRMDTAVPPATPQTGEKWLKPILKRLTRSLNAVEKSDSGLNTP